MCGGSMEDNSDDVARIEARTAREEARREELEQKRLEEAFNKNLEGSFGSAIRDAERYFRSQGLNPDDYMRDIMGSARTTRGSVPFLDANPSTYFAGLGEDVYGDLESGLRNQNLQTLRRLLPEDYAMNRIGNDADDATIEAILGEQKSEAQKYLDNLLARGVITNSGYQGGLKNLDTQSLSAKASLDEIGRTLLESGRGDIDNLILNAQDKASNLMLGDVFNPYSYRKKTNSALQDFFESLGGNIRGKAPTDLFDTSGLAGVAGASQGAQNTKFDTNALAGLFGDDDDDDDDKQAVNSGSAFS